MESWCFENGLISLILHHDETFAIIRGCYKIYVSISVDLEKNYKFLYTGGDTEIQKI